MLKTVGTFGLPRVHHDCVAAWPSQCASDTVTAFHRDVSELNICGNILNSDGRASRRGLKVLSSLLGVDSCTHHQYSQCSCNQQEAFKLLSNYYQTIKSTNGPHIKTMPHFLKIIIFCFFTTKKICKWSYKTLNINIIFIHCLMLKHATPQTMA